MPNKKQEFEEYCLSCSHKISCYTADHGNMDELENVCKSKVTNVDSEWQNTLKVCCNDMTFKESRNCVILDTITVITMVEE